MLARPSRRIRSLRTARAVAASAASVVALGASAAPAAALNVVNEHQAVVGRQCVGVLCPTTGDPSFALQVRTGDTPGMRLEQTADRGWMAQTWDVAGNEANFFVRDLTADSQLPFRIFPGTPTNGLTLRARGVGIGTHEPVSALEVRRADARLTVTDNGATAGARVLADLVNQGAPLLRFQNTDADGQDWLIGATAAGAFAVRDAADGSPQAFLVTPAGTATARGILQQSADPALRADVQPVDGAALLARLRGLEVTSWTTAGDATGARHLGPSGADFHAAFGVGHAAALAPSDLASVALLAARQLAGETDALSARLGAVEAAAPRTPGNVDLTPLQQLRDENAALRRQVEQLEAGRRSQARKLTSLAKRQRASERRARTSERRLARLTRLVGRALAER